MKFATNIIQIKTIKAGQGLGYGNCYKVSQDRLIATLALGYYDGLSVNLSNKGYFVVNKQKAPIVGGICMDLCTIDITDIKGEVKIGDEIFIFDNEIVTLEDIAKWSNTIGSDIMVRIGASVERVKVL